MLKVDLGQLGREGSVLVEASVPAQDELWDGADLAWTGDVEVRVRASEAGTGEVVARGTVHGKLAQECRRCLTPVETDFRSDLTMVFLSEEQDAEDDGGVYLFEATGRELDLGGAVREEVILAMNPYVVCKPECRGLCPRCGTDLNEDSCDCTEEDLDPRWAALRELKSE